MRKKIFLLCSVISLLLVAFPFSVCADETTPNSSSGSEGAVIPLLDSYFYDNYDLLPYIESSGTQYIDTDIPATNDLLVNLVCTPISVPESAIGFNFYFGASSGSSHYRLGYLISSGKYAYYFNSSSFVFSLLSDSPYSLHNFVMNRNLCYLDGALVKTFPDESFSLPDIYVFGNNGGSSANYYSSFRLYKFSIYDYSLDANDQEIGYVRYYYPAKAKTSGSIGLYDAVSKTFFTSLGSDPFASPTDDKVLNFQISDFLTSGLTWIGDILDFVIETPILIFFMAIGLAGVAFRWSKRVLHF